ADRSARIPVLALRDVEFAVAGPVADRALVHDREAGDVAFRRGLRDAPSALADDDCDFAFVVELRGLGRAEQRLAMSRERAGKARKQARVFRLVRSVLVLGVA